MALFFWSDLKRTHSGYLDPIERYPVPGSAGICKSFGLVPLFLTPRPKGRRIPNAVIAIGRVGEKGESLGAGA